MATKIITPSLLLTLFLTLLITCLSLIGSSAELLLEFNRANIAQGEYWRLLTSNLVHYGFMHTIMNVAALLLIGFSFLRELSPKAYIALLITSAMAVNLGTLAFNPELDFYRGFSGVLHGLLVAGLLLNRSRNPWLSYLGIILVFAKIIHEHQADFQANQLQAMLPVNVAVDSHLYGALAGLMFFGITFLQLQLQKKS